jgi:hypothetical protein
VFRAIPAKDAAQWSQNGTDNDNRSDSPSRWGMGL